jgi:hypothetical protein
MDKHSRLLRKSVNYCRKKAWSISDKEKSFITFKPDLLPRHCTLGCHQDNEEAETWIGRAEGPGGDGGQVLHLGEFFQALLKDFRVNFVS